MVKSNIIKDDDQDEPSYLDGQLLIAMPNMKDPRFERTVIFMCAHSEDGAMGIILNQPAGEISFSDLLEQLDINGEVEMTSLQDDLAEKPVHVGGPVETSRGFVLHSPDYYVADATLPLDHGISLTATVDILRAIAGGEGPKRSFLALGYAGWAPGQLEHELQSNGWLHCEASADLIFTAGIENKYDAALALLGIDPSFLASEAGHA